MGARTYVYAATLLALTRAVFGDQFTVRVDAGKWKGDSDIESVFPQFEIRLITDQDSEKQPLDWLGQANFDIDRAKIRQLEWTIPVAPLPKWVLWPRIFKTSVQQGVPNPFTRFQLFNLKQLYVESKDDAVDSVRDGRFDAAEKIFRDVNEVYEPYLHTEDPKLSSDLSLFVHQIYESMSDQAARFRKTEWRELNTGDQKKVVDLERNWHRSMIERYTDNNDEAVNRRLAGALLRWSEFARFVHCRGEWPSDSIGSGKQKQPPTLTGDLNALHEDVAAVANALLSTTVTTGLKERIERNLASSGTGSRWTLEKKQLACYANLLASHEKADFNVDDIQLDDFDRAISAFGYFHHAESGK